MSNIQQVFLKIIATISQTVRGGSSASIANYRSALLSRGAQEAKRASLLRPHAFLWKSVFPGAHCWVGIPFNPSKPRAPDATHCAASCA
jgi:hypothetical protein